MDEETKRKLKEREEMPCGICGKSADWIGGLHEHRFKVLYIQENGFCPTCDTEENEKKVEQLLKKKYCIVCKS